MALFAVGLLIVAVAATQTSWFKDWLRRYVTREAEQYLNARLVIERLDGNLFTGIELQGVSLVHGTETVIAAKDVGLDYNAFDFVSGGIVIDAIRINEPTIRLARNADGWNVAGLVKEQAQEADREGPARTVHVGTIGVSNGTVTIADATAAEGDAVRLPKTIARIDLRGAFDYKPVSFTIDLAHLSFRADQPALALNSLSGLVRVSGDDVQIERLAVRTAESSLSAKGAVRNYLGTPAFDLALSSDRLTPRELAGIVPSLAAVRVDPAFELSARGPLDALDTGLSLRSDAGAVRGRLLIDSVGPDRGAKGSLSTEGVDLSRVVEGLPASSVTASSEIDVTVDGAENLRGRARVTARPSAIAGYQIESLDARATLDKGRARIEGSAAAYGARATTRGTVDAPIGGKRLAVDLEGRIAGLDVRRLPRAIGAPRLATRLGARYRVALAGAKTNGEAVFDRSTIEGATIAAGTRIHGTMDGDRIAYGAAGSLQNVDPQRLGRALGTTALADPRLSGRVDTDFTVEGRGRTLHTIEAHALVAVPQATLAAGELRGVNLDARLTRGALDATLKGAFANVDPAVAAARPDLAGAVSGTVDAALSTPNVTRFSLSDAKGQVRLTLEPSRIAAQTIDKGVLAASLAGGVLDVTELQVASPFAIVSATGPVALTADGESKLAYHAEVADLSTVAALAGQSAVRGAALVDGRISGNRAELHTTGTLSLDNAAYGDTLRAVNTDARYEVTLPDLDPARAHVKASATATLVEAGGRSLREVAVETDYADRRASFGVRVAETDERSADLGGQLTLRNPGVDLTLDRLTLTAPDAQWALGAPAHIAYDGSRVDVANLSLVSGQQKIDASGAVAIGAAGTQAIAADRPLRLRAERVDLAALDRLARTGRQLAGTLDATATIAGSTTAPHADATIAIRDGAVGDFKYRAFDATLRHDDTAARVEAKLDQDPAQLTLLGTLPPLAVLRDEARRRNAPIEVRLETSAIDLGVAQAFTTAVRDLKGTLQAKVHATGTLAAPKVDGDVRITGGALTVPAADTTFSGLEADLGFRDDRLDVRRFEIADKDGKRLTVTGGVGLSSADRALGRVDLKLTGQDFRILDGDLGRMSVDVDLGVRGEATALRAEGTVAVRDGRIEVDHVLEEFRPTSQVSAPPPPGDQPGSRQDGRRSDGDPPAKAGGLQGESPTPSMFDAMAFDVRVTVPNNLVVRGDGVKVGDRGMSLGDLNMTLGGDLRTTKAASARPIVIGSIRTVRGYYEFQGRRFELRRDGAVSFKGPDPTNPQLDVTATRDISGVEARVRVHGEAQRPALELSSTPPLDEGDILSLIIFNRPINDLGEGERTTLAQRAGSMVGGFVAAPVAEALRDALDVDLLEITPLSEEGGGSSVSIGNQIGEKVFVKVRQQFGSSETTQLVLEYELSKLLRLETQVQQGGDTTKSVGHRAERGGADLVFVIKY
jgi:translocation and assembly module TamB